MKKQLQDQIPGGIKENSTKRWQSNQFMAAKGYATLSISGNSRPNLLSLITSAMQGLLSFQYSLCTRPCSCSQVALIFYFLFTWQSFKRWNALPCSVQKKVRRKVEQKLGKEKSILQKICFYIENTAAKASLKWWYS